MSAKLQIRIFLSWMVSVYMMAVSTTAQAAEMALAQSPLFLGTQIDPNTFFMLDDSGSMDFEVLTGPYQYYTNYWRDNSVAPSTPVPVHVEGGFLGFADTGDDCTGRDEYDYIYETETNPDNAYTSRCELEGSPQVAVRDWRIRNADLNIMYYNPAATYQPWIGFTDASFTAARSNPQLGTTGYTETIDLTGFTYETWIDNLGYDDDATGPLGGSPLGPKSVVNGANGIVDLWDSHVTYTVNASDIDVESVVTTFAGVNSSSDCDFTNAAAKTCFGNVVTTGTLDPLLFDIDPYGRTVAEVRQNVANWYQYHRRRSFVMKAAVARVMNANTSFRFGLSLLNDHALLFRPVPAENVIDDDFPAHNDAILAAMYSYEWDANGTPLRRGLERVGRYYSDYYSADYDNPIISACQQNYAVLFTDGFWSGSAAHTAAIGDEDLDGATDSLADVAHYFYNTDLSPLPNDVPTSPADTNDEQHMVTFAVAFGVQGILVDTDDDGWPDPVLAEDGAWNDGVVDDDPEKIDDLWHAAFNSKGTFVSAQTTDGVAAAIAQALLEIADRVGSAASVATNTGSLNADSHLFQARFDSSDWKGQLLAFQINPDGTIDGTPDWEAGSKVNAQNYNTGREIITYNPDADVIPGGAPEGQGIPFRFPADYTTPNPLLEFSSSEIADIMSDSPHPVATGSASFITVNQAYGTALVNYLRGDRVNEGAGQDFRIRGSVLGDIVNSDPKFVKTPNGRYADDLEAKSYNDFISDYSSRDGVVYVGANDGMLHGFDEDTGNEVIAYVPTSTYEGLFELASEDYDHRYYVDGGPNIIDAYMDDMNDPDSVANGLWRTVLVSGVAGGGQTVFALDVTDPTIFNEANAADIALWEFDDSDDADLGYTYGRPQIAKMADGTWAAVFGNGYNNTEADGNASATGHAVLYIVDIETGDLIKKIDTMAGDVLTPNGLATPLLVDEDADSIVDYVYAGDLLGNMWKFDVTNVNPTSWSSDYASAGTPDPLFTAATNQPITTQPQATFHPDNFPGFMIFFGTGQYLEINDNDPIGQTTQTFYSVWDKNAASLTPFTSSDLLAQTITDQYLESFDTDDDGVDDDVFTLREVSDNEIDWDTHMGWKLDLMPTNVNGSANVSNFGERQVSNAIVRNGRVIFTTLVPSSVECEFGGTSFLMQLDFRSGGALEFPAFDLNSDGEYDGDDGDASGRASDVGIMPTVSILSDGAQDVAFGSGASGDIDVIQLSVGVESYGRQSWRQLE